MTREFIKFKLILFYLCIILISCTEEVNFDQADDFQISPVIESSLIFLNEPVIEFLDNGIEIGFIQDSVDITIFSDKFIQDNLIKAEFVFETTNSINRGFLVQVDFFGGLDQLVHTFAFSASPSPTNTNIIETHKEEFSGTSLIALKTTRRMVFTLSLLSGIPINEGSQGLIQLKSKGVFYLNINNSI